MERSTTAFPVVNKDDLKTLLLSQDFDVVCLGEDAKKQIELRAMQEETRHILRHFKLIGKDEYADYTAIGLQYEDDNNPLYDANEQLFFVSPGGKVTPLRPAKQMTKLNEVGLRFRPLIDYLATAIRVSRGRLLKAAPGFRMNSHRDGFFCGTLHYPIFTNPACFLDIDGRRVHLPADGRFYFINVNLPHSIANESNADRLHITFPVTPLSFNHWTASDLSAFEPFLRQFNLREEHYRDRL